MSSTVTEPEGDTPTYVNQVKWVEGSDKNIHLTFIGNSSKSPITIDQIIEQLCECNEEEMKKDNDDKFETLYQLIIQRLPMMCLSSELEYVKYIQWIWLNQNPYPIYVGPTGLCEIQNSEVIRPDYPITNETISTTYYRFNTIISNPSKNKFMIRLGMYDWTWIANTSAVVRVQDLEELLENFQVALVESEDDPETIPYDSISDYTYTTITNSGAGGARSVNVTENGDTDSYTCRFQGTSSRMIEVSNKYIGLYIKFSSEESPMSIDSITFTGVDDGNNYLTSRYLYIHPPGNDHALNFSTYIESLKPFKDQTYTVISNKEDYDEFFDKSS